jgi:hypothetical protein
MIYLKDFTVFHTKSSPNYKTDKSTMDYSLGKQKNTQNIPELVPGVSIL